MYPKCGSRKHALVLSQSQSRTEEANNKIDLLNMSTRMIWRQGELVVFLVAERVIFIHVGVGANHSKDTFADETKRPRRARNDCHCWRPKSLYSHTSLDSFSISLNKPLTFAGLPTRTSISNQQFIPVLLYIVSFFRFLFP